MNLNSTLFIAFSHGYLDSTLHGKRGELRHNHIHALQAGSAEFEDLLFDYCLKSQVRGEETRSERGGIKKRSCGSSAGRRDIKKEREEKRKRKAFAQLVI